MTDKWCEHDEVAAECLHCKLRLAEAHMELLEIRLQRTLEGLTQALEQLERDTVARTHWEGCEAHHPICKIAHTLRALIRGEDDDADQTAGTDDSGGAGH